MGFMKPLFVCRGYQRIGENVTKGTPDMHEAIDVSIALISFQDL